MAYFKIKPILRLITLYDLILVIIILFIAFSSLINKSDISKQTVFIYYQEKLLGTYDLSKDVKIRINENCLALISKNKIRMLKSDCPDKLCVKKGWSDNVPIVCLPNKIVMEIHDDNRKQEVHILH